MWFLLSKLIYVFLKPLVWICLLLGYGILFRKRKYAIKSLYLGVSLLFIFSNPFVFNIVSSFWEAEPIPISSIDSSYDYAIILGGFSSYNKKIPQQYLLNERGDRLTSTLSLYFSKKVKKIWISGGASQIWEKTPSEAILVRDFLLQMGIPEEDIILEKDSKNTYENALFSRQMMEDRQENPKCLLITSAFHMPRAKRLFRKQKIDVTPFPTDHLAVPLNQPRHIIIPGGKYLDQWDLLFKEWVGIIVYWIKGDL